MPMKNIVNLWLVTNIIIELHNKNGKVVNQMIGKTGIMGLAVFLN